jgi:hypothetical protein
MMLTEPGLADWDITIERARTGTHAEDKLLRTVELLEAALQRARLRGDAEHCRELRLRVDRVHRLLDYA